MWWNQRPVDLYDNIHRPTCKLSEITSDWLTAIRMYLNIPFEVLSLHLNVTQYHWALILLAPSPSISSISRTN